MGLMGRPTPRPRRRAVADRTNGIHMMFMRFPIDAVFLGKPDPADERRAAGRVASIAGLRAWTGLVPLVRGAHGVLELPVGTIERSGTAVGDLRRDWSRLDAPRKPPGERPRPSSSRMATLRSAHRRAALDLAFPAACSGCGREGAPLCAACLPALDARLGAAGRDADRPARPTSRRRSSSSSGARRSPGRSGQPSTTSSTPASGGSPSPLGAAVARRWARVGVGADVVVPVPVHAERERQRGYDQAALIAAVAGARARAAVVRALERGRATVAQFDLGRDERAANVAGAFRVRAGRERGARADRRALGPARRRRRDDRRDARGLRRRARARRRARRSRRSPSPASAEPAVDRPTRRILGAGRAAARPTAPDPLTRSWAHRGGFA